LSGITIEATPIPGVMVLSAMAHRDERGSFARLYDRAALAQAGIDFVCEQTSLGANTRRGTLRGLHYQAPPAAETKIVHCVAGTIFDVAVDLRRDSPTFRRWHGVELSAANGRGLLIPKGCAHGFLTLADHSAVLYQIDTPYAAELSRGARWDDPAFAIAWPFAPTVIGERDAAWADFAP
jgi:dTDP-4-dehydrorhamnose 3,5-epimerase